MTTTIAIDQYKLETIFNSDDTVSHIDNKAGHVSLTTWGKDKELGVGSFGEVWREREMGGEFRAVKTITKFILKSCKIDYKRELQVLVKVKDYPEFFVVFLGWYEDRHAIYLAMEYVNHGDLGAYMAAHGVIAENHANQITKLILQGLVILHGNGICHRDLKPQNILIASLNPIEIKIADFGISAPHQRTYLQTSCGTRSYQAPEQLGLLPQGFHSNRGYTKAVDIWALGVLLYKMLTSELPFQTNDTSSIFHNQDLTIMTEADQEPTMDLAMLLHYCDGSGLFPMEPLQGVQTSPQGVAFVMSLLAAKPKERMSANNARQSPWITGLDGTLAGLTRVLKLQYLSLGVHFPNNVLEDYVEHGRNPVSVMDILESHSMRKGAAYRIEVEAMSKGCTEVYWILPVMKFHGLRMLNCSLLQVAAAAGHLDTIRLLLSSGADVNLSARSGAGKTALQEAAEGGHLDAMRILLISGADVNAKPSDFGRTALQAAAEGGHLDAMGILLSSGADVNAEPSHSYGRTALQVAAEGGHLDAMRILLRSGADINAEPGNLYGKTALQAAAEGGHLDCVLLLLESGADVNTSAVYGTRTVLEQAVTRGVISPDQLQYIYSRFKKVNE